MFSKSSSKCILLLFLSLAIPSKPVQLHLQQGEELNENNVEKSELDSCMSVQGKSRDIGVCLGKEVINNLNKYDELDSFSLAAGVTFVRDEKSPRDIGSFLDKDPMDIRNLISKRSLHWDLSMLYPGLIMKIGPTLANGVLEFGIDPRIKDRTYSQANGELSAGRLLAKNFLVPFLLGFKFQLSTLLPLILGLLLVASKKAFLLAKVALIAVTLFGGGSSSSSYGSYSDLGSPTLSSYTSFEPSHYHGSHHHHHQGGYYNRHPYHAEYNYKEKSAEQTTASPITPEELRNRLERLFITKKDTDEPREETKIRNARNFAWTPINAG
ncbi:hypothetical protein EVAR_12304_1 [Eumeta japonica]|uniref:Osiris 10 n=1 Tax=Eumeta variegata TaxID=151549 RepID=A0A4C1TUB2_EUMVA|nr:hypothetical protein EVAR_12304_1 [Eumeta japonica]